MIIGLSCSHSSRGLEILTSAIILKANAHPLTIQLTEMVIYTSIFIHLSIILSAIDSAIPGDLPIKQHLYQILDSKFLKFMDQCSFV